MADPRNVVIPLPPGARQIAPVPLVYSIAQRVSHNQDFTDKTFENCVDVVHTDIVNVWNLRDNVGVCLFPYPVYLTCSVSVASFEQNLQDKDV